MGTTDTSTHAVGRTVSDILATYDVSAYSGDGTDDDRPAVTSPDAARDAIGDIGCDREVAVVLLLDTKHRLIRRCVTSVGSVDHTFMAPREVFRDALIAGASVVVVAHSHPSGDPEPSRDDERIARRLARAGEVLGVDVLDSLVIGSGGRFVSLARRGVL
jgi:DNA repair protein RadC